MGLREGSGLGGAELADRMGLSVGAVRGGDTIGVVATEDRYGECMAGDWPLIRPAGVDGAGEKGIGELTDMEGDNIDDVEVKLLGLRRRIRVLGLGLDRCFGLLWKSSSS